MRVWVMCVCLLLSQAGFGFVSGPRPRSPVLSSWVVPGCWAGCTRRSAPSGGDDDPAADAEHRESEGAGGADAGVAPVKPAGSGHSDDLYRRRGRWCGSRPRGVEVQPGRSRGGSDGADRECQGQRRLDLVVRTADLGISLAVDHPV
jgi:hypothetical protein